MSLVLTRSAALRYGGFFTLYFAQGVPIGLLSVATPAWLAERGASVGEIASFVGVVALPWAFKLLAGPLMDRFGFPPMGFRRPWVLIAQGGLVLSLLGLAAVGAAVPLGAAGETPWALLMACGFVVNVFGASQDVAVDGMAIDVLPVRERGRANAFMACGQVVGYSLFGYVCAWLLTRFGLAATAFGCAVTVGLIFAFATAMRERPGERLLPWTVGEANARAQTPERSVLGIGRDLARVFFLPMSLVLVAVEFVNRVRDGVASAVFPKFAVELGYSAEQYAAFNGWIGFVAAGVGVALGPLIDAAGAYRFLFWAFVLSACCHLLAGLAPALWQDPNALVALWLVGAIAGQVVFVAIIALFMNLCWSKVAATQFAVYMSLANLSRSAGSLAFAEVADGLSFAQDFLIMAALLFLAAVLLRFFNADAHAARLARLQSNASPSE